jgi:neutral ceramidase
MMKLLLALWLSSFSLTFAQTSIGVSEADLTPEMKVPLGGYGSAARRNWPFQLFKTRPFLRLFKSAQGSLDLIRAKVMTLNKDDQRIVWISLDVVGAPAEIHAALSLKLAPLGIKSEHLFISATHTHSGPGALSKNHFWQVFAMDRFQNDFYQFFIEKIVSAVKEAIASETSARLYSHRFKADGLTHSRRASGSEIDREVTTLLARSDDGRWLGGIVNFAIHGVCLDDDNLFFSSDAPGSIERNVEDYLVNQNPFFSSKKPTVLLINGAEGDISPDHYGKEGMERIGNDFIAILGENWNSTEEINTEIKVKKVEVNLGTPKVLISKCVDKKWIPKWFGLRIRRYINSTTTLSQIRLGQMLFVTWPGEPTSALGLELKNYIYQRGYDRAVVMGLTNDHLAYFTTPEEYLAGGYETCVNFFGADGGKKILETHKDIIHQ